MIPLIIVTLSVSATIARLIASYRDVDALRLAKECSPSRLPLLTRLCQLTIIREWIRVAKHIVCIFCLSLTYFEIDFGKRTEVRDYGFAAIAILLFLNSCIDAWFQRDALRRVGVAAKGKTLRNEVK